MSQLIQKYDRALEYLIDEFQKSPHSNFSECDFQYHLYSIFRSPDYFNLSALTNDGVKVGIIHPEYPSVGRVQLGRGKGYRVWFDLAILNPDFIKENSYKSVSARDERDTKLWGNNVLAVFEFKYFPKKQTHNISYVQQDCLKLSLCTEIDNRYVLVFSGYEVDVSDLKNVDLGKSKLIWVTPNSKYVLNPNAGSKSLLPQD